MCSHICDSGIHPLLKGGHKHRLVLRMHSQAENLLSVLWGPAGTIATHFPSMLTFQQRGLKLHRHHNTFTELWVTSAGGFVPSSASCQGQKMPYWSWSTNRALRFAKLFSWPACACLLLFLQNPKRSRVDTLEARFCTACLHYTLYHVTWNYTWCETLVILHLFCVSLSHIESQSYFKKVSQ
jgi:hypothetical protein